MCREERQFFTQREIRYNFQHSVLAKKEIFFMVNIAIVGRQVSLEQK